jgi:hypothetical protein
MNQKITELLGEFTRLVQNAHQDTTTTQRRVRFTAMSRLNGKLKHEISAAKLLRSQSKRMPTEIRADLAAKGWVDISQDLALQERLAALKSKSVLRRWYVGTYRVASSGYFAVAPKWAAVVGKYAPDRLKEAFSAKEQKRKALVFQLEAQFAQKGGA